MAEDDTGTLNVYTEFFETEGPTTLEDARTETGRARLIGLTSRNMEETGLFTDDAHESALLAFEAILESDDLSGILERLRDDWTEVDNMSTDQKVAAVKAFKDALGFGSSGEPTQEHDYMAELLAMIGADKGLSQDLQPFSFRKYFVDGFDYVADENDTEPEVISMAEALGIPEEIEIDEDPMGLDRTRWFEGRLPSARRVLAAVVATALLVAVVQRSTNSGDGLEEIDSAAAFGLGLIPQDPDQGESSPDAPLGSFILGNETADSTADESLEPSTPTPTFDLGLQPPSTTAAVTVVSITSQPELTTDTGSGEVAVASDDPAHLTADSESQTDPESAIQPDESNTQTGTTHPVLSQPLEGSGQDDPTHLQTPTATMPSLPAGFDLSLSNGDYVPMENHPTTTAEGDTEEPEKPYWMGTPIP